MNFLSEGKKKEVSFSKLFKNTTFSGKEVDIKEHWDLSISFKIDVKGLKKISRSDNSTNEHYHFVELKNVQGNLGWLYGEADYFAFETDEYWVVVKKEDLQNLVKDKVSKTIVNSTDKSLYCLYSRQGRKDIITMVKTLDLVLIATQTIPKEEDKKYHTIGNSIYK